MTLIVLLAALQLPLVDKPVVDKPANGPSPYFALLLTGDGGWRAIDEGVTAEMNRHGIPVAGLLSDRYFSKARTSEEVARDVESAIAHYSALWKKQKVILIGFSRGADALPVALAHMSPAARNAVVLAALLGPARSAELEIVPFWKSAPSIALAPLVRQLAGMHWLCVHGEEEDDSLCDVLGTGTAIDVKTDGGHHFGGRYAEVARAILAALPAGS